MLNDSRISIYRYVENILTSVTENVYLMNEPQELTQSDTEDGFIVIRVGDEIHRVRGRHQRSDKARDRVGQRRYVLDST